MRHILPAALMLITFQQHAFAADIRRVMAAEIDPVAPAAAAADSSEGRESSMWGASADFNVGPVATGPELWVGNFNRKGPASQDTRVRREDLQYGEQHKVEATRLRWTVALFEKPDSMRGWFVRTGYSWTKVNSRAKRDYNASYLDTNPTNLESVISDTRHGVMLGFGQRWTFLDNKLSATLSISSTQTVLRKISDADTDPDARSDFDEFVEETPWAKMSTKAVPEANLSIGYLL
jgi:hypothetical protein